MFLCQNMKKLRLSGFFMMMLLFLCSGFAYAANVEVKSAPLVTMSSSTNGMVRVYLSSMGNPSRLNITVDGSYSINGNSNQALANGEKIVVNFSSSSGTLTVTRNGVTTDMGSQFALRRHSTSGSNGILIAESYSPGNPYPGDVRFIVDKVSSGYKLYTIAYVYIENYLYGVLPYEMGNSAHIEALKAQAIAARTYTLRAMQSRTGSIYDVVDTTGDQVYRGTPSGYANCKAAVDATKGIVVMNGSYLTGTFYTASNGGQTEASKNIWGGSGYSYLCVKDDPFDLANPDSVKKTATIYGDAQSGSQNASLRELLNAKAAAAVKNMGYNGSSSVVSVLKINSITPHTPKYGDPSRLYTKMDFELTVRTLTSAGATVEVAATVTCEIFGDLEGMLGMSISSSQNELWSVSKSGSNFILYARRYGHGVGLSQRGAMQMGRLGYTYDQIVGFYYEGCKRVQHNFTNTILSPIVSGEESQEETTVEEPADIDGNDAPASAIVNLVNSSDLLGIRKQPSATADILGTVPHGVPVKVWAVSGGWAFIQYGSISGYVQQSALDISGTAPETTDKTPSEITGYATVTASNYLNLREKGAAGAAIVGTAPSGAVLSVFSKTSDWAYVQYGAIIAYASTDFLKFTTDYPGETTDPSNNEGVVTLPGETGTVNMRSSASTSASVLQRLPNGTAVTVLRNDGTWCKVKYQETTGYIVSTYITMTGEAVDNPVEDPPLNEGEVEAVVNSDASTLNLRETASLDAAILLEIPKGESIIVTEKGDTWCAVRYEGVSGFVMTQYLLFDDEENTPEEDPDYAKVTTQSGSLNMRTQGKTGSTILCTIPQNAYVEVVSKGDTWTRIKYAGYDGFVMSKFLTFLTPDQTPPPTPTPGPTNTPVPPEMQAMVTTPSGSLNMRKSPSLGATVITAIPKNETVTVITKGEDWTQVAYNNKTGYVMTKYITFLSEITPTPSPTPTPTPEEPTDPPEETESPSPSPTVTPTPAPSGVFVNTQSGSLNLRAEPKPGATIILRIPQYAQVTLLSKGSTWSKVSYGGKTGYVMTTYLGFGAATPTPSPAQTPEEPGEATPTPSPTPEPSTKQAYVKTQSGSLNMRKEPKAGSTILLRIPQYAQVTLLSGDNTWSKVSYGGKTGYVMTTYLGISSATPTPAPSATPTSGDAGETTPTPTPTPASSAAYVNTQSGSLNMRNAPRSGAAVILRIPQYANVTLVSKGDVWSKISYGGKTGYVMTMYLGDGPFVPTPTPTPSPTPSPTAQSGDSQEETQTPSPTPASGDKAWVNTKSGSLNMRKSATAGSTVIMTIPQYSIVGLLEKGSSFCKVSYGGTTGYVMTEYLAFTGTPPNTGNTNQTAWVYTDSGSLNVRSKPESSAMKIGTLPRLSQVTVYSKGTTWSQVSVSGLNGYVMTRYLTFTKPAELSAAAITSTDNAAQSNDQNGAEPQAEESVQSISHEPVLDPTLETVEDVIATVNPDHDTLNLRSECSDTAQILLEMNKGETVEVLMLGDTWCKVKYGEQVGYCMTRYLTLPPEI